MSRRSRPAVGTVLAVFATVTAVALGLALVLPAWADLWSGPRTPSTPPSAPATPQGPERGGTSAAPGTAPLTRLGGIGPLTGPRANVGAILRVTQALVARGGAGEVVVRDDGSMPLRTIPAARFLEHYHRIQAFLSPLETAPVASLLPYLAHTKTPTLFLSTTISQRLTAPHVIGFPPTGAGATQVLAEAMQRAVDERVQARRGEPSSQGVWVIWADTEDGRDRIAGFRRAGLAGLTEVSVQPERHAPLPAAVAPEAALIIGTPAQVVQLAAAVLALPPACVATETISGCAQPPAIFAAVFEPFDWSELAPVPRLVVADWLRTDAATLAWHRTVLQQVLPGERPSRLTLWGHALGEVTDEVLRRAGPSADGTKLLAAARSLRDWQSRLLPAITLDARNRWPIEHVAIVTLTRGQPSERSAWLSVPRPRGEP
ncbi:MAG: ABC transporter substrate-binding protein [Gemmatimonadetes bacterium]|nr:ABC transporter substrate-binding protein [Gemmatimonadota bacterium]